MSSNVGLNCPYIEHKIASNVGRIHFDKADVTHENGTALGDEIMVYVNHQLLGKTTDVGVLYLTVPYKFINSGMDLESSPVY